MRANDEIEVGNAARAETGDSGQSKQTRLSRSSSSSQAHLHRAYFGNELYTQRS